MFSLRRAKPQAANESRPISSDLSISFQVLAKRIRALNHEPSRPKSLSKLFCRPSAKHNHHEKSCRKIRMGCRVCCVSRLLGADARGGGGLDSVGVDGGLLGGGVGGGGLLVLLHLVVVLEVAILLLVILVVGSGVLLGGLGEVDDLAAGTVGDDVVQVEGALGVSLSVVLFLGYTVLLLEKWESHVVIASLTAWMVVTYWHPRRPMGRFVSGS